MRAAYDQIFSSFVTHGTYSLATSVVLSAVHQLELQDQVRPDAIHLLIVTLHEMVIRPVTALQGAASPHPKVDWLLIESLYADVMEILSTVQTSGPRDSITPAGILKTTAEMLDSLNFTDPAVWGALVSTKVIQGCGHRTIW